MYSWWIMLTASLRIISAFFTLLAAAASAQRLAFDAAAIKPHRDNTERNSQRIDSVPGRLTMHSINLAECIEWAWNVKSYQVFGPAFLREDKFDLDAKAPGPASLSDMRQMLRILLGERFHLRLHPGIKELPVYKLVVVRGGPKLHKAEPDGHTDMRVNNGAFEFRGTSMQQFADDLSGLVQVARPVLDRTALPGAYDFNLKMAEDAAEMKRTVATGDGPSIFTVIQEQLGLRLGAGKSSVDILVVDSAERLPTEN